MFCYCSEEQPEDAKKLSDQTWLVLCVFYVYLSTNYVVKSEFMSVLVTVTF